MKSIEWRPCLGVLGLVVAFLTPSCTQVPQQARLEVTPDTHFTGRGNHDELLATLCVHPDSICNVKYVEVQLNALAADVAAISLKHHGEELCNLPVREGKNPYRLKVGKTMAFSDTLQVCADIQPEAIEGHKVSVDVLGMRVKGQTIVPDADSIGSREILLCRKCLYRPGDYGSNFWRIPALLQLRNGTLLAVNDRRNKSEGDLPEEIDVVSRYSMDGGRTWSEPQYVAKNGGKRNGYGDPGLAQLPDGTVICTYAGGENNFYHSTPDEPQRSYYSLSKDNGRTWEGPFEVTELLWGKHPLNPYCTRYRSSFFTSGNALVLQRGPHKGRMLVANVTSPDNRTLCNHVFHTDDGGQTWHLSDLACDHGDEAKMVERLDGSILMSIRHQGERLWTVSTDYGQTWGALSSWPEMCTTACNGDLIRYNDSILLHSIPNAMTRRNVSVFLSSDDGRTWPEHKTICAGPSQYSSLTVLPDGTIGAYIEENCKGTELWYENFSMDWLRTK